MGRMELRLYEAGLRLAQEDLIFFKWNLMKTMKYLIAFRDIMLFSQLRVLVFISD